MIDLTAIAPYYLALCGSSVADRYDGELRMLRIFRLLTLDKYIPSVSLIGRVFRRHAKEFQLAAFASAAIWLIFSALMWLTERHDATQVDDLTMAQRYGSMPEAMPYTLVHLTGDYPLIDYDFPAKCVLFVALLFAVGVVAVPTGLLASGFAQELTKYREEQRRLREEAATKIEKALRQYIRRRRLRQVTVRVQAQRTALRELKDKAQKDSPHKLLMVKFLEQKTTAGRVCKKVMFLLIVLNVLAVIGESMSWIKQEIGSTILNAFELVSVLVFTFEYAANVWSAPANSRYMFCRRNYIVSFFGLVDLVTVAPFWIQTVMWISGLQFNAFIFRIARLLRILQLEDFVESFTLLDDAWRSCRETMVATGFMALLVWICGAVLFYEFEQDNPSMDGAFKDLPSSMSGPCFYIDNGGCRFVAKDGAVKGWRDSKRLHCEEAAAWQQLQCNDLDNSSNSGLVLKVELLRLSLDNVQVAELKALQAAWLIYFGVQEITDLRSMQAEELLKLEVDWTTQVSDMRSLHSEDTRSLKQSLEETTRRSQRMIRERDDAREQALARHREGSRLQQQCADARHEVLELSAQIRLAHPAVGPGLNRSFSASFLDSPTLSIKDAQCADAEMLDLRQRCKELERQCTRMHGLLEKGQEACERWRRQGISAATGGIDSADDAGGRPEPFALGPDFPRDARTESPAAIAAVV
ncbi:Kcnd2 [Symbiodinium pilosum]|uniref:Kcnd2 protein n=1 Tax=Symbiodinium pilosum TaxID=2952 RepID=A0A812SGN0_SYMPI|nr:Kcnd2 [Symbiodinium pilosum]